MEIMPTFFSTFFDIPFLSILVILLTLIYWIPAFFIIYHLVRFGVGPLPKIFALVFFLGSMFLFAGVVFSFKDIDFSFLKDIFKSVSLPGI